MKLREILLSAGVEDIMHTNGTPPTRCLKATEAPYIPSLKLLGFTARGLRGRWFRKGFWQLVEMPL
ncbi:MAG: hypothetical protein O6918_03645 [Deltaproteobacteria bacterium]|nr:hypothetical protein [Deltaproteobacteria bacterium]